MENNLKIIYMGQRAFPSRLSPVEKPWLVLVDQHHCRLVCEGSAGGTWTRALQPAVCLPGETVSQAPRPPLCVQSESDWFPVRCRAAHQWQRLISVHTAGFLHTVAAPLQGGGEVRPRPLEHALFPPPGVAAAANHTAALICIFDLLLQFLMQNGGWWRGLVFLRSGHTDATWWWN